MARLTVPGRWITAGTGYKAFVPEPLPPRMPWSPDLVRLSSEASLLLGRLAGEGGRLPNPHVFIRPFLRREAVLSSKIEGTQATLGEVLAAEAGLTVRRSPADLREVANYVVAMEYGIKRLRTLPLSLRLVREVHEKLMRGVRGDRATPGAFRRSQNWIGDSGSTPETASYVPPPPDELMACLGAWETFLHDRTLPPVVQIGLAHYQFEAIHPFLDGNGRVGRLLVILFLIERGILPAPLLYLSAYFEATRPQYYQGLQRVTRRGEWEAWITYFLTATIRMSEDVLARAAKMNAKLVAWRHQVAGAPRAAHQVIEVLAENPYISAKSAAKRARIAFTTAQRGIETLEKAGIVERVAGERRGKVYCAKPLLRILEAKPRLTGGA